MMRADIAAVSAHLVRHVPPLAHLPGLREKLETLLSARRIRGGIIEVENLSGHWQIGAAGLSAFVTDETLVTLLSEARAGFAMRFLNGNPELLLDDKTQAAQAHSGLNLIVIAFVPDMHGLPLLLRNIVLARSLEHFITTHRGYHIKSLLREDPDDFLPFVLQTGLRVLRSCSPELGLPLMHIVGFLPEDIADAIPGSVAQMLLHFAEPRLGCTVAECRVLDLASTGLPDSEIAHELDISPNTLKQAWRSILDRAIVLQASPKTKRLGTEKPVRGPELRTRILSHLRDHPQDMRPWALRKKHFS